MKNKKLYEELSRYLCNDQSEFENIISTLKKSCETEPDKLLDYVDGIDVWEKVQFEFTVKEFCELIKLK